MARAAAEHDRLLSTPHGRSPWRRWGPYLAERSWGTVREDYSADGDAWVSFPHDAARSRAYRWSEDGLGGICDDRQTLCLALAFWNGADPILKERIFGLTGHEGNHGEDAKEEWWYVDSTPTHSWMRWRYRYPQRAFPYERLVEGNRARGRSEPEYELADTGIFDDCRFWEITADYAKASPEEILVRIRIRNAGPEAAQLDVLPTLWFRNTWSWDLDDARPSIRVHDAETIVAEHAELGRRYLSGSGTFEPLFCDNETNARRLYDAPTGSPYPKDGINDHVVDGRPTVNPALAGTKACLRYRLIVGAGATAVIDLRLSESPTPPVEDPEIVLSRRRSEADAFYGELTRPGCSPEDAAVMRQAFAGMLWSKQFYHYDVRRWLDGDPTEPAPPPERLTGRNARWRHLDNRDVISVPDAWEYPWYASWDLAFHCLTLAHVDPDFAKNQLLLLGREWFMHPNGQIPAYEWALGDVNPPLQAWAALRVFEIDGRKDHDFLERVFHKLLLNFTWWVNREDSHGDNLFAGGFLGLDNIGPLNRSRLPGGSALEQSDGTAWMAAYCGSMLEIALELAGHDPAYEDMATKFYEHFALIATAINDSGLWSDDDGFYFDRLRLKDGTTTLVRSRSWAGLVPLLATTILEPGRFRDLSDFTTRTRWFVEHRPEARDVQHTEPYARDGSRMLSIVDQTRLRTILTTVLDPGEFLSDHGIRSLSKRHAAEPAHLSVGGIEATLDYEPGESTTALFGGNSNWRGPIWLPVNYLLIQALRRYHRFLGPGFTVELPTGSGRHHSLDDVADEITRRLLGLFRRPTDGIRPAETTAHDEPFDTMLFHEYFHAETGAGLGASHQTGWTALVANLVLEQVDDRAAEPNDEHNRGIGEPR